jgi:hypothetical protein
MLIDEACSTTQQMDVFQQPDEAGIGSRRLKKGAANDDHSQPLVFLEAATGFEPVNNGFADRCLSHLAMPPKNGAGERI